MPPLPPRAPNGEMTWALSPSEDHPVRARSGRAGGSGRNRPRSNRSSNGRSPTMAFDARDHAFWFALLVRVGTGPELQIDAIDVVGLLVQQRRVAGVERRLEPEPAFARKVRLHLDIADEEAFLELAALEVQDQGRRGCGTWHRRRRGRSARRSRRARPASRLETVAPSACGVIATALFFQRRSIRSGKIRAPLDQVLLDIILLQIDEGRHLVAGLGQQVEVVDFPVAVEQAADLPGHALGDACGRRRPAGRKSPACAWPSRWRASRPTPRCCRRQRWT